MLHQEYKFNVFADYFQFSLEDEGSNVDLSESWTEQAVRDLFAVTSGAIGIRTVRNMNVPVTVEIHHCEPIEDEIKWQHITECSITAQSGNLVVIGCTDYFPDAPRIQIKPDTYQARIYYSGLDALSEDGLDGDYFYKVIMWAGKKIAPKVIKRHK